VKRIPEERGQVLCFGNSGDTLLNSFEFDAKRDLGVDIAGVGLCESCSVTCPSPAGASAVRSAVPPAEQAADLPAVRSAILRAVLRAVNPAVLAAEVPADGSAGRPAVPSAEVWAVPSADILAVPVAVP
jgi:hypothetical protein